MKRKILIIFCTLVFFALIAMTAGNVGAKSLYTIAAINASPTPIEAYNIEANGSITFQAAYGVPAYSGGAVGIGIDSDSATLFVTYEFTNIIQLLDATTMADLGTTTAPSASNLAGIVVDQDKGLLYTVDRWTDDLYIYQWYPSNTTLVLQSTQNLIDAPSSFGIALDEINDILYVANYYSSVMYYDTDTWAKLGEFAISHYPQSIAVDVTNQFVYTGSGWGGFTLISKYDLNTANETTSDIGQGVMGMAVDPATNLLYCNIGIYIGSASTLRVFDSDLNQLFSTSFDYNSPSPTGLCIPGKDISYNPLNLTKDDGLGEEGCVIPGENINYTICFDNLNQYNVTNVTLEDNLPANVSFSDASDGGSYDGVNHTVNWDLGTILSGDGDCIWLLVEVDSSTPPETTITNYVTIDSDETPPTTKTETTLTCNVTVDTTPPIQTLEFGNPKTYREWFGVNYTIVSCTTPIWINSTDPGGVGSSHITYSVWYTDDPYPNANGSIVTEMIYEKTVYDGDPEDIDATNGSISVEVLMNESCFHEIIYQCWDYNNNTDGHRDIDFIVDCSGPNTSKIVGQPQYGNEYPTWVSCQTPLWFNSTDEGCLPNGTAVDYLEIKVWWKSNISDLNESWKLNKSIVVHDGDPEDTNLEYGRIGYELHFDDDCGHEIWWRGVDIFGNAESWKKQKHKVDCTPPETIKEIGEPKYYNQSENITYVTTQTPIWLNTTDYPGGPCAVGCEYLHWEIWWKNETGQWELLDWDDEYDNQVELYFDEECEHKIIWWAVDYLGNKEDEHVQYHKVDDTPPQTPKEIGEPKYREDPEDNWWVTTHTPIWLNTTDYTDPCAVGCEYLYWEIWWKNETGPWELMDSGNESDNKAELYFTEECEHAIVWWAVDYLGNEEDAHLQFHMVDDTPPIIEKEVGMPKYNEGLPPGDYYITSDTPIWINATDDGIEPCIVGSVNLTVGIWYNGSWTYYYDEVINGTANLMITLEGECIHQMVIKATDDLGNVAFHNETFYVDNTPPDLTKIHPDPGYVPIPDTNSGYLNCQPIILESVDPGTGYGNTSSNPTANETILQAIDAGLAWLANQQDNITGVVSDMSSWSTSSTAFAVLKWAEHATRFENKDPFDPTYNYSTNIEKGLDYIFTNAYTLPIHMQLAGDPDGDGDGIGVYFISPGSDIRPGYETPIALMAIAASQHPERLVTTGALLNWTYGDVAQDMVDWIAFAQQDSGWGRGGWRYCARDNGSYVAPGYTHSGADNSVSQWPVLGFMEISLSPWNIVAPQFVKDENLIWLAYTQNANGGFGYTSSSSTDIDMTASGMIQLTYCGKTTSDGEIQDARDYIGTYWNTAGQENIGDMYSMYAVMKAAMTTQPNMITHFGTHDWGQEYDDHLLANQHGDGHWSDVYGDVFGTEWALLILQRIAPEISTKCASGVESIFWRYEWNQTEYPEEGEAGAVNGTTLATLYGYDEEEITLYWWYQINDSTAFVQFIEECEHDLYYFTKDNVYNRGPVYHQTYLVDCTPPDSWKWFEGPHYNASQEDITKFNLTTPDEIEYFWLRDNDTTVIIEALDNGTDPCIAGLDYIHIELWWDSDGDDIIDTMLWEIDVYDEGYDFQIMEDCLHEIRWYAVDILGNMEETHHQYHRVDSTPPESVKTFNGPTYPEDLNENGTIEPEEQHYWVTSETEVTITAIDQADPCAVGVAGFHVTIWWDSDCDDIVDTLLFDDNISDPYNFSFTFEGLHVDGDYFEGLYMIGWNSTDHLGNEETWTEQYHKVDDTPPHIIIIKPVDGWYKDGSGIPSVVFAEDLTNPHGPCNLTDDGAVGIEDGRQGGGFLIDIFPIFNIIPLDGSNFTYDAASHEFIGNLVIPDPSGIPDGAVLFVANGSDNLGNGANSLLEILHAFFIQCAGDPGIFGDLIADFIANQNIVWIGIDNTSPSVDITEPEDGDEIGPNTVYISASMSDILSGITPGAPCYVTLDGISLGMLPYNGAGCQGTLPIPGQMPSGDDLPLEVSVYDNAGNEGSDVVLVDLNNQPPGSPTCAIISPANGTTHEGTIHVVIEAHDGETIEDDLIVSVKTSRQYDPDFIYVATYNGTSGYFHADVDISKYTDGAKIILQASATDEDNNTALSTWVECWVESTIVYDQWLTEGWNTLSLPLGVIACNNSLEKVLFSIYGDFDVVFYYDVPTGVWSSYVYGDPHNTLTEIFAGKQYFIRITKAGGIRFYTDIYPPIVIIDDPEDGEVKEEMDNTNIFAYDNESWITDVYVEIYDQNDSLYYNGSGWQPGQIWLLCYYVSGDEWAYDTTDIWTNDHIYVETAMAYDAGGCTGVDSSTFTIHWEEV